MRIVSIESVFPEHYVEKQQIIEFVKQRQLAFATPSELNRLEKLHRSVGVQGRHFALPLNSYHELRDVRAKHSQSISIATDLGKRAVAQSLHAVNLPSIQADHFIFASSSVISCPTVDARIISDLELRSDVKRTPLLGLGCAGGLVGLSRAADYLRAFDHSVVVLCAVEIISLLLRWEDCSANAQTNIGLFGDASAAAVVVGSNHPLASDKRELGPTILASRSVHMHDTYTLVRTDLDADGSHPTMAHDISEHIGTNIRRETEIFLAAHGLRHSDIGSWICHPGGPNTIAKMSEALSLPAPTADLMRSMLQTYGNISSANILVLLQTFMRKQRPAPGTLGLALTYGPGFSFEFVLMRW